MLNIIWGSMIVASIIYAVISGNLEIMGNEIMNSAKEAVSLGIGMLGMVAMWSGIMEIAKESGVIKSFSNLLMPFISFMFPKLKKEDEAMEHITVNIISNIFGLGAAATPAGLKAMRALEKLEEKRCKDKHIASDEMCTFLVLNISSLQLIPVNMIAYRSEYGSVSPLMIVVPGIMATLVSTLTAIIFIKLISKKVEKSQKI